MKERRATRKADVLGLWGRRTLSSLLVAVMLGATFLSGCAVIDPDRRHLTKIVEKTMIPEKMTWRIVSAPVWGIAGIATLIVDGWILNPVFAAPDALDDAGMAFTLFGVIWPAEIVLLPVRAVGFAGIFIGSDIVRCMVPYVF